MARNLDGGESACENHERKFLRHKHQIQFPGITQKLGMVLCPPNSRTRKTETGEVDFGSARARPHDFDSARKKEAREMQRQTHRTLRESLRAEKAAGLRTQIWCPRAWVCIWALPFVARL